MLDFQRQYMALHLAHRWFAFLEAPVGDLHSHLSIFHPQVRLSGHRGHHLFAHDHDSLITWFAAVPDEISSHHIVHANFATAQNGEGHLNMVIAYQTPTASGVHGSIISYETRIEFSAEGARFIALDKTPILANTRPEYETSWAMNRVLARVYAELAVITESDGQLTQILGEAVSQVTVHAPVAEASTDYVAQLSCISGIPASQHTLQLTVHDDGHSSLPSFVEIQRCLPVP
ncbi:hypothetical protein [Acinetobacter sp. ANC 4173]|uniref:hypothetical protein n=1 Tax=Acinetobacter sp. ANC 4173 TaxID=2529837 RepID=UPI00103AE713|nr:hypothetical protein [Acinetobacter sp. ANC 4173]TCB77269.1 hypothetical protein E0H94_15555 [Acinetobacter sp. ANC 4173]